MKPATKLSTLAVVANSATTYNFPPGPLHPPSHMKAFSSGQGSRVQMPFNVVLFQYSPVFVFCCCFVFFVVFFVLFFPVPQRKEGRQSTKLGKGHRADYRRIIANHSHPKHDLFQLLLSMSRYRSLRARTDRLGSSCCFSFPAWLLMLPTVTAGLSDPVTS